MNQRPGRRLRRLSMRGAVLLAGVLTAGALAHAAQASTLAGGGLVASTAGNVVTAECGPTLSDPFTYHVEGTSVFTHAGTFTEDGTVVVDTALNIVSLDAEFTITSPLGGNVTGEKHYLGPLSPLVETAACDDDLANILTERMCYRAEFADGSPPETGRSTIQFLLLFVADPDFGEFSETFTPDATVSCGAAACPDEEDEDGDGLINSQESRFFTLLGNTDSDFDGIPDGDDDANGNGEDDEDEDDDEDDECPDEDSDGDGEDDEDEDDEDDD